MPFLVKFRDLTASGLPAVEAGSFLLGNKQDPYLRVRIAGSTLQTSTAKDAGAQAAWSDEVLELGIPEAVMMEATCEEVELTGTKEPVEASPVV